jgi:ribA/ribD-fused uncharacterized protein
LCNFTTINKNIGTLSSKIDLGLRLAEDWETVPLDLVLDGGLTTIAATMDALSGETEFDDTKAVDILHFNSVRSMSTPGLAKAVGRKIELRPDWKSIKHEVMRLSIEAKFTSPTLREKLLQTEGYDLLEGNQLGDTYWGVESKTLKGKNHVGLILMKVREGLKL